MPTGIPIFHQRRTTFSTVPGEINGCNGAAGPCPVMRADLCSGLPPCTFRGAPPSASLQFTSNSFILVNLSSYRALTLSLSLAQNQLPHIRHSNLRKELTPIPGNYEQKRRGEQNRYPACCLMADLP